MGHPVCHNLEIIDVAAEGNAIGRHEGKVVFVGSAVPGDVVNVQITRNRAGYMEGYITEFIALSPHRIQPFCSHFGICGGCKWQPLPYAMQLALKQKQVADQFARIGRLGDVDVLPIIASDDTLYYRNKLEFTFSNKRWLTRNEMEQTPATFDALGFHVPGKFDKVLDIDKCFLQPHPSNDIRLAVRRHALELGIPFFDLRAQSGLLRTMIVRNSVSSGEVMVIVVFAYDDENARTALLPRIAAAFPQITSLCYIVNPKRNDAIHDLDVHLYAGRGYMEETLEDLVFKISPKSFFQTNTRQALRLYQVVRDFAGLTGVETVYDLYTGTGSIALFLARQAAQVIGIEMVDDAIADAEENARRNRITNTRFYAGDMRSVLKPDFFAANGKPDVIVLDPPRAGIHPDVAERIVNSGVHRLVYVSCNPATQARDMALLSPYYRIVKAQPVDMFPHTHHVENVLLAEKQTPDV
ncbi:MAG: 23S rRNA (uracil(1939)-C(5))-methyltransferase RlmD [Prevotellaceae bacterium]|jgi:23S rRNA (uracil1939-C5)-methyltransferase|nr:23S rRNA (uracil(1939)-C(5))-methyltransferase RlmD [Prevotellaceae bacterium]